MGLLVRCDRCNCDLSGLDDAYLLRHGRLGAWSLATLSRTALTLLSDGDNTILCEECMNGFMNYLGSSDPPEEEKPKLSCYFENCKFCLSFLRKKIPGEDGIAEVRCGRKHRGIQLRGANPNIIDIITPEDFDNAPLPEDPEED